MDIKDNKDIQISDIIIAGGGLAGLSLALQINQTSPNLTITIVEKNQFPIDDTTAKVGESTVEIGSHYFTEVLGLKEYFKEYHLQKFGLRCFFGNPTDDYAQQDELGVSQLFGIPTYQIERGKLENYLQKNLVERGITIIDNAITQDIDIGDKKHTLTATQNNQLITLQGRWLIDAAGRQALIKNKLGLQKKSGHKGNAIFFRIDKKVVLDEWTDNSEWQDRLECSGKRWLSTNHLMGAGYWVWIIPLSSGATSIGIVLDDQALEESQITSIESTLEWLTKEQPKCAESIRDAKVLDFHIIKDYSFACKKTFSDQGWALTGESGVFSDPFYSPGSDFIAISNTFISHLIQEDFKKNDIRLEAASFQLFYHSFFESTLSLYKDLYGGFGDRRMMSIKLVWDYSYYWGVLSLLFFKGTITDVSMMRKLSPLLTAAQALNKKMQMLLAARAEKRYVLPTKGLFLDQFIVPCLNQFSDTLKAYESVDIEEALAKNVRLMEKIVPYFEEMLQEQSPLDISAEEQAVLGDYRLGVLA